MSTSATNKHARPRGGGGGPVPISDPRSCKSPQTISDTNARHSQKRAILAPFYVHPVLTRNSEMRLCVSVRACVRACMRCVAVIHGMVRWCVRGRVARALAPRGKTNVHQASRGVARAHTHTYISHTHACDECYNARARGLLLAATMHAEPLAAICRCYGRLNMRGRYMSTHPRTHARGGQAPVLAPSPGRRYCRTSARHVRGNHKWPSSAVGRAHGGR